MVHAAKCMRMHSKQSCEVFELADAIFIPFFVSFTKTNGNIHRLGFHWKSDGEKKRAVNTARKFQPIPWEILYAFAAERNPDLTDRSRQHFAGVKQTLENFPKGISLISFFPRLTISSDFQSTVIQHNFHSKTSQYYVFFFFLFKFFRFFPLNL